MKFSRVLLVAAFALGAVGAERNSPTYVRGFPVGRTRSRATFGDPPKCTDNQYGSFCEGCSTLKFCVGKENPVTTINCAESNPSLPYCVNNQCSSKTDDDNCKNEGTTCAVVGYQPDPKDCTRYLFCKEGKGQVYVCPPNYVYDHSKNMCKKKSSEADCAIMNCTNPNSFITYAPDPSIYAWCNDKLQPIVLKCEDDVNEWFDPKSFSCRIACKSENVFSDRRDCKKYYQCFLVNNKWQIKHYDCPNDLYFDKTELRCIPGKDCKNEITKV
ncbi:uncharacterized protein LOC113375480 [Ctenocephalides felis]|uniref:uncharacterized protein LOC113375480 n=1 Tax=Ctenocephalides felis TaxID=7515 RepID=UPI000E6E1BD2|nr:uncharacterized protein LOC113375480 [Ctenocephalides felis]